jgi:hypothetical protein
MSERRIPHVLKMEFDKNRTPTKPKETIAKFSSSLVYI